ncbi:hypothetical protein G4Y79_18295 [Phototrophicus methaneseepsis]|uniref:Uncharacterized protein n=1 Tax=Phototrophicus methaneseepsis TaxID=2710758 RepID=A0A7S8E767_9CHLR|nr:hypothetical protein [Phototrophicus methaneseepsis]QPC81625.1 hypothetical protein G4Y79_18295 [Phototrophicus methaneseepsis]
MVISETQTPRTQLILYWIPPLVAGLAAFLLLVTLGGTPIIRSGGLALVIVGVSLGLRRMGAVLSIIGGMTLLFIPAFWVQSGGPEGDLATIVIALIVAAVAVLAGIVVVRRPALGLGIGVIVFAGLFFSQIGTPQSLRLTGFVVGWLLFLMIDMLLITNPHPGDSAPLIMRIRGMETSHARDDGSHSAQPYHTLGMLMLFTVGILNDPLLVLLAPAIILSLTLTRTRLARWYWVILFVVILIAVRSFLIEYIDMRSYWFVFDQWRQASRWFNVVNTIIDQFSIVGVVLSVLGISRLARWYPPLGVVTMFGYGAFAFFGLVYIGPNRAILLMPMFIIQITWMTYAVFAIGEWAKKSLPAYTPYQSWVIYAAYGLLPLNMLAQILNVVN